MHSATQVSEPENPLLRLFPVVAGALCAVGAFAGLLATSDIIKTSGVMRQQAKAFAIREGQTLDVSGMIFTFKATGLPYQPPTHCRPYRVDVSFKGSPFLSYTDLDCPGAPR